MSSVPPLSATRSPVLPWWVAALRRLHLYIGFLVGPFLLVAALSGMAYALTPQLENWLYADALNTRTTGAPLPLADQIAAAQRAAGPAATLSVVRPAPGPGFTTRVMFNAPGLGESESRAIFVDPVNGEVLGDHTVYGTSGILPLRTAIDQFHRALLLGTPGRLYSELAASWLWLAALGGCVLWAWQRCARRSATPSTQPSDATRLAPPRAALRRRHATLGLWLLLGLVFFSATGLTWSRYAGANIGAMRQHLGWATPTVSTALSGPAEPVSEHAHHEEHAQTPAEGHAMHGMHPQAVTQESGTIAPIGRIDAVLAAARSAGIDAERLEIRPARQADRAWTVTEINRRWPTQVDAVAIDARNLAIVSRARFEDYPLAAKLTRWGVDLHMGVLFGWPNQLMLVLVAGGLAVMTVWGYLMVWRRRRGTQPAYAAVSLLGALRQAPPPALVALAIATLGLAWALPVLGWSLPFIVLLDIGLTALRRHPLQQASRR